MPRRNTRFRLLHAESARGLRRFPAFFQLQNMVENATRESPVCYALC